VDFVEEVAEIGNVTKNRKGYGCCSPDLPQSHRFDNSKGKVLSFQLGQLFKWILDEIGEKGIQSVVKLSLDSTIRIDNRGNNGLNTKFAELIR
jgi:hypothetical protein